ncbi:hypothetical protein QFW77_12110 [Luteimonas sp. RD2P54]|uniref:DUF3379 family protein n=1 Tax=Luteimonas endophytica TaxID=3042023 RepID=A0ABT6JA81_9GAMM|nr:hypothetical protein [Luteimonas endophytica]MDH5823731.1 hypothetical protein [Luteimonas endophytica]
MNEHDERDRRDEELGRRLRSLPREMVPPARAWARVEARIGAAPLPRAPRGSDRMSGRWRAVAGLAAAASLALLLVSVLSPRQARLPAASLATVQQAERMRGEYRAALASVPAEEIPAELQPALAELDHSAASIFVAIREAPGSRYLLDQLQRTYAQRLQLTRRAALDAAGLTT